MKKNLTILFIFIAFSTPTWAVITPEEAASKQYIKNHGYSNEMSRLINLQDAQVNGTKTKYVNNESEWYKNDKKINFIRKVFMYFDCGLDDGKFMQNNIDYTNRWDDL